MAKESFFKTTTSPIMYFLVLDYIESENNYHVLMMNLHADIVQYDTISIEWANKLVGQGRLEQLSISQFSKEYPHVLENTILGIFEILYKD